MIPLLFACSVSFQTPQKAISPPEANLYVLLAPEEERSQEAEREREEIVAGKLKGVGAKSWIVQEREGMILLIHKSLVEDKALSQAQKILTALKTDRTPPKRTLGSMSDSERGDLAQFFAQSSPSTRSEVLNARFASPKTTVSLRLNMLLSFEDGASKAIPGAFIKDLMTQEEPIPSSQVPAFKAVEVPGQGQGWVLRFSIGFPSQFRSQMGADALKTLESLRKEKLDRVRADLDQEGWRRVAKLMANPKSWDGRRPITFGELDPVLQEGLRKSNHREFKSTDRITGAKFDLSISLDIDPKHRLGVRLIPKA
ncbi:hypothetical protein EON79_06350 [bacterium]|nr:MAG: hypothetical protein EON79_06350 [bacterium]